MAERTVTTSKRSGPRSACAGTVLRYRATILALAALATLWAGAARGENAGAPANGENAELVNADFIRSDEAERLMLALESAQTEVEEAAAARAEVATFAEARSPLRRVQALGSAVASKLASNRPLLAGAGIAGGMFLGIGLFAALQRAGRVTKRAASPRAAKIAKAPAVRAAHVSPANASATPALSAAHAEPARDAVSISAAARAHGQPSESENVWSKILRLSAAGMSGDEIARALGASADDINLVLGLQRRRVEIAGALAHAGGGRVGAVAR
jgi:hypothetical protein